MIPYVVQNVQAQRNMSQLFMRFSSRQVVVCTKDYNSHDPLLQRKPVIYKSKESIGTCWTHWDSVILIIHMGLNGIIVWSS